MIFARTFVKPSVGILSAHPSLALARFFSANKASIEQALRSHFKNLEYFGINDESSKHFEAHDSHFVVHLVTDEFASQSMIQRHRSVTGLLKKQGIMERIHALSLKTDTVEEFRSAYKDKAEEMLCRGGGKYDKMQKEKQASQQQRPQTK